MKSIFKLKKKEYAHGAQLALQNAKGLVEVAQKASEIEQYGVAVSLLIVGLEELAKASVLQMKALDNSLKINNLNEYFHSHKTKHESIFKLFVSSLEYLEETPIQEKEQSLSKEGLLVGIILVIIIGLIFFFSKSFQPLNSLETLRMSGFYVGINKETADWETPSKIFDKEQYDSFKELTDEAFHTLEGALFSGRINAKNVVEFAESLEDKHIIAKSSLPISNEEKEKIEAWN